MAKQVLTPITKTSIHHKLQAVRVRPALKFKFNVAQKKVLHASSIGLQGGGKIKIQAERNLIDEVSILPNKSKTEEGAGWTCHVQDWDAEVISRDTAILNPQFTKIYVGGVYDFTSIANGEYKTLPYARKPLTIVSDNNYAKKAQVVVQSPSSGHIQAGIVELVGGAKPGGSRTVGTAYEMLSEEDFFMRTGGSGYYLGFGGSHQFNFKDSKKSHKYIAEIYQAYYTIFVDDSVNEPKDFFYLKSESTKPDALDEAKIDPNWVYVDSVTYGRVLYLVYESDYSFSEYGIEADMYANIGLAGGEANLDTRQKKILQSTKLTVGAVGGSPIFSGLLSNQSSYKDLKQRIDNFFNQTNDEVKIAFTLSTLDQATVGTRMITKYTSRQCAPRASAYRITWKMVVNSVNDDSGSASEIKAFVRIMAFEGNGKAIMDADKKNQPIAVWEKLPESSKAITPKPWTFIEGSASNPLDLKEGENWEVNKHVLFKVPEKDNHAKLAIRVDVLEFDDFDNDNFQDNYWEGKIADLSDHTPVSLVSRHEGSRVTFLFVVEPIYET
jgi:hypothetical protein